MVILGDFEGLFQFQILFKNCLAIYWTLIRKKCIIFPGIKVMLKEYPEQICLG